MKTCEPGNYAKWSASRPISVPKSEELQAVIRLENPAPIEDAEYGEIEETPPTQKAVRFDGPILTREYRTASQAGPIAGLSCRR